jgi:hypothetical protein
MVAHVPLSLSCHCKQCGACTAAGFKVFVSDYRVIQYQNLLWFTSIHLFIHLSLSVRYHWLLILRDLAYLVTFRIFITVEASSSLCLVIDYCERFLQFCLLFAGKCWDSISNYTMTTSFLILANSFLTNHHVLVPFNVTISLGK